MMRRVRRLAASGLGLGVCLCASMGEAQPSKRPPPTRPFVRPAPGDTTAPPATAKEGPRLGHLRSHFGVPVADRLLRSPPGDLAVRRRGLVRLAAIATPQALELLLRTWETDAPLARDGVTRLAITRALAPLARDRGVRELLQRMVMLGADPSDDVTALAAGSAALALAGSDDPDAFDFLVALARQDEAGGETVGEIARRALVAHPPATLPAALAPRSVATVSLVRLASELGDVRALPFLRGAVRNGPPDVRLAALAALGKLGDGEAVPIGRAWVNEPEAGPRLAGLRVLAALAPDESIAALVKALAEEPLRAEALALAATVADARLLASVRPLLDAKDESTRAAAIVVMGKMVDERAPRALEPLLGDGRMALAAAAALASSPATETSPALARALRVPARRVAAVHASLARKLLRGEDVAGLADAVAALALGDAVDRATAAFARASLGRTIDAKDRDDEARLPSVVRGLLARSAEDATRFEELAPLLDHEVIDEVAAVALLEPSIAARVPSARLLAWADTGGAHAPLATEVLAARDEDAFRGHLERLQRSPDLALRAHLALGLGRSARPDAAARLASAYERETRPSVRSAIVRALARHTGIPVADRTLALARSLDADEGVRALAAAAALGARATGRGRLTTFVRVEAGLEGAALRMELPSGVVLPVRADPGGVLAVPGTAVGEAHVSLAVRAPRRDDGPR